MRVSWVTFGSHSKAADGTLASDLASVRYRILIPAKALESQGVASRLFSITQATPAQDDERALDADVIVFSKSFLPRNEALAERASRCGVRVLLDLCDNHYDHPQYAQHYRNMSALADQVVCNTAEMAAVAAGHASSAPVVIEDPFEGPRGAARFAPSDPLKLLWYGHPSNLDTLNASLADLAAYAQERALELTVLTQPTAALVDLVEQINSHFGGRFRIMVQRWSLAAQWRALADCDAVLIPTLQGATKQVKSANRMIEALWAGKPVVAQPLPSYQPFGGWTPVGASLPDGCRWLEAHAGEVPGRIAAAQDYIAARYSPNVIGGQWAKVIAGASMAP